MSFIVNCHSCHVELEAEEDMIDSTLNCPNCRKAFVVKKPVQFIKGKVVDTTYPPICIFGGVIMLINAAVFFYQALTFDPWRGGSSQMYTQIFFGIIFLLGGIGYLARQKFGMILGGVSIGLFLLGVLALIGTGELFKNGLLIPVLINTIIHAIVFMGILSFRDWEKLLKNPPVLASCPGCETKFKLKGTQLNKNMKCASCAEVFTCIA